MLCQVILMVQMFGTYAHTAHTHSVCSHVSSADMYAEVAECKKNTSCKLVATKDRVTTTYTVKVGQ